MTNPMDGYFIMVMKIMIVKIHQPGFLEMRHLYLTDSVVKLRVLATHSNII